MRKQFLVFAVFSPLALVALSRVWPPALWGLALVLPLVAVGLHDMWQTKHAILRNFPVVGHGRYLLERLRPPIQQYFIESNTDGMPVSREHRSLIYQRAKDELDTVPFGTQQHVYEEGYEWMLHSIKPCHVDERSLRVQVGGPSCTRPYSASVLNISAMSYGSLSQRTGEGGLSPYHLSHGGDIIWQIGTGYFGCRTDDGAFDGERFTANADKPEVRMIELKISQGAKPGKGGILPACKVTEEISRIRHVPMGKAVISPPAHSAFDDPIGMMRFIQRLRELSGGKPVGFKLCVGYKHEFFALCKAMRETGIMPDYIAVDGGEGATGAAPLEFTNSVGSPLDDGLAFVCNALRGFDLRKDIRVFAGGRIFTSFHLLAKMAIGADAGYSARAMMLALGCIQALECNKDTCPTARAGGSTTSTTTWCTPWRSSSVPSASAGPASCGGTTSSAGSAGRKR
jgi:glutamate synthase domain-containing protein 2